MKITYNREAGKIWLDQEAYISKMLKKFQMDESNPVSTPSDPNQKLTKEMSPTEPVQIERMKKVPYKEAVGSLLHVSQATRPDISYAINAISRYMQNPGEAHWTAVKRILCYLKGMSKLKLEFSKNHPNKQEDWTGYSDADWSNESNTRRSITGYVFIFRVVQYPGRTEGNPQ